MCRKWFRIERRCIQVPQSELDLETVRAILSEYKIHNADVTLRYDASAEDLIDIIEGNRVYMPCIYILNKIDQISIEELDVIYKIPHCVPISAHHKWNFDDCKCCRSHLDSCDSSRWKWRGFITLTAHLYLFAVAGPEFYELLPFVEKFRPQMRARLG